VTDDTTHKANWDFLCKIVGSSDFMYVADSKLATRENMSHIANRGGRFISVLPRTRAEHKEFQGFVLQGAVRWKKLFDKTNKDGEVLDVVSTVKSPAMSADGFRLLWFHSTRKTELDRTARAGRIRRAFAALSALNVKLKSPKTRFRDEERVRKAVHKCLADAGATEWVTVTIVSEEEEKHVQTRPGRPGPKTSYRRETRKRFSITYHENYEKLDEALQLDGMFPLVTNDRELSVKEIYDTYKKQAHVEKRFSQLKTQFRVAPVYLKSSRRVVALLTTYYLAMLVQSLIEREIRRNMEADGIEAVALYPEERDCKAPTTRRIMDLFETIQLHELKPGPGQPPVRFVTDLSQIQREILRLLRVPDTRYKA
jgi:transposase